MHKKGKYALIFDGIRSRQVQKQHLIHSGSVEEGFARIEKSSFWRISGSFYSRL